MTRLTGLVEVRASLSDAGLDLREELGLGAVAGEVGEGGAAVGRQGGGETLKLLLEISYGLLGGSGQRTDGARGNGWKALSGDDGRHGEEDGCIFIHGG